MARWCGQADSMRTTLNSYNRCYLHTYLHRRTDHFYAGRKYTDFISTKLGYSELLHSKTTGVRFIRCVSTSCNLRCKVVDSKDSEERKQASQTDIPQKESETQPSGESTEVRPEKPGVLQRFKDAYKEYGKTLIGVHVVTSVVWYGAFYYAARTGIDVVPLLEWFGASEQITKPFKDSGAGDFAVAYLLYELAKVPRYIVTLAGTQFTVKFLRRRGLMAAPAKEDSLRNLVKEGRTQAKTKYVEKKGEIKEKIDDSRDKIKDRIEDSRDKIKDRIEDSRDKIKDRIEDSRDKIKDRIEDSRDKIKDRIEDSRDKIKDRIGDSRDKIIDKLEDSKDKLKDRLDDGKDKLKAKIKKRK